MKTTQNRDFYRHFARVFAAWFVLAIIIGLFAASGVRMTRLSRDPHELANIPLYYGLISNMGILVWAAGAFVSLFASYQIDGQKPKSLLRWSGVFTTVLLLDDFFLIHDAVFPRVLGLPEWILYLFYVIAYPAFLLLHFEVIFSETEYRMLGLGLFLLGLSVLVDIHFLPGGIDVEDGLKLSGMIAYSYYWILTSHSLVANSA